MDGIYGGSIKDKFITQVLDEPEYGDDFNENFSLTRIVEKDG